MHSQPSGYLRVLGFPTRHPRGREGPTESLPGGGRQEFGAATEPRGPRAKRPMAALELFGRMGHASVPAPAEDILTGELTERSSRFARVASIGVAYMLKSDKGASNTDPYAKGPTPDNHGS
jgi:hypothetical protein